LSVADTVKFWGPGAVLVVGGAVVVVVGGAVVVVVCVDDVVVAGTELVVRRAGFAEGAELVHDDAPSAAIATITHSPRDRTIAPYRRRTRRDGHYAGCVVGRYGPFG
jgi:hypothetical protein